MSSSYHKNLVEKDLHAPSRYHIENGTLATIPQLMCVKFNGVNTQNYPKITPCTSTSDEVDGVVEDPILASGIGYVVSNGMLHNINTVAWPVNTKLYCTATGTLSTVVTTYTPIATVLKSDATQGILYVHTAGSGVVATSDPDYSALFAFSDWVGPSIGYYTILFYHGLNAAMVEVEVWDGSNAVVGCERLLTSVNEVTLRVPALPDLRFDGKIWCKSK